MLALLDNPAVVALVAGIPSLALAVFGYMRATRLDKRAEVAGTVGEYRHLVEALKEDNKLLRKAAADEPDERVAEAIERIAAAAEVLAKKVQ